MAKKKKVKTTSTTNKEYPIMWLTLEKKGPGDTLRTVDWKTGETVTNNKYVFRHNGLTVKISDLNKIFGTKNYVIGLTSNGRYFVRHHTYLDPTDAQGKLHDWSESDNPFDKALADAYKNTGLTPPDEDVETVKYYRPGWFDTRSREVPNQPILHSWGTGTGVDSYLGSAYDSGYLKLLHSDPTGLKSLFGNRRTLVVNDNYDKPLYQYAWSNLAGNAMEGLTWASDGFLNRLSPTLNIGLIIDAAQGDNIMESWFGNSGIVSDKFAQEHPYWSMAANIAGDGLLYYGSPKIYNSAKTAYNNGTFYDKYTTIGGRFGYYGNPILRVVGTVGRNLGIKTTPKHPELLRKIEGWPRFTEDGKLDFNSTRTKVLGEGHSNWTVDRPVVSHKSGNWDGKDLFIVDPKAFGESVPKSSVVSIEPSDFFAHGADAHIDPSRVTVVTGDPQVLKWAQDNNISILSSPRLRKLFKPESKSGDMFNFDEDTYSNTPYTLELQRLQQLRGAPTIEDIRLMESTYGKSAGVIPYSEYLQNSLENAMKLVYEIKMPITWTYPNGRELLVMPSGMYKTRYFENLNNINKAPYKNIFYDPTSHVESLSGVRVR